MAEGYNPNKSRVAEDKLNDFVRGQLTDNLTDIPGIGPASAEALKSNGINTPYQLIGKFLSLKDSGVGPIELADRFYYWLKSVLPSNAGGFRAGVVRCIAEKVNLSFPGVYNPSAYEEE